MKPIRVFLICEPLLPTAPGFAIRNRIVQNPVMTCAIWAICTAPVRAPTIKILAMKETWISAWPTTVGVLMSLRFRLLVFALAYWAGAELSYLLLLKTDNFVAFWPPAGIYLAMLLTTPQRRWGAVVVAAGIPNFVSDVVIHHHTFPVSLGLLVVNLGATLLGAALLTRMCRPSFSFAQLPHVLRWSALFSLVVMPLGALGGAALVTQAYSGAFAQKMLFWWIGDLLGILLLTPLTYSVLTGRAWPRRARVIEATLLLFGSSVATVLVFRLPHHLALRPVVLFFFLLWAALRFGATGVAFVSSALAVIAIWLTEAGFGPYSFQTTPSARLLMAQTLIITGTLLFYIIAAVMAERRAAESQLRSVNVDLEQKVQARTTKLVAANEQLRASEERLRLGVEVADFAICEIDYDTDTNHLTTEAARLFGLGNEAMSVPRAQVHATFHPDERETLAALIEQSLNPSGNGYFALEHRVVHKNGVVRWLNVRKQIFFDQNANPPRPTIGILAAQDITERKQAEEKLRASVEFNRTVLENSPDCVKLLDSEGRLQFMNANGLCLMEIDDFAPLFNEFWWQLWAEETQPVVKEAVEKALRGEAASFQAFCPTARSTPKWWDIIVSPIPGADGKPARIISVSRDITARKQQEEALRISQARLRLAMDTADILSWEIDAESGKCSWSENAARVLDFASEVMPKTFEEAMAFNHPDDNDKVRRAMETVLSGRQRSFSFEQRLINPADQTIVWVQAQGTAENIVDGKPTRLVGVSQNITERKRAEERLRESETQIRLALNASQMGVFISFFETETAYWSPETIKIFGAAEDFAPTFGDFLKFVHADDRERLLAEFNAAIAGGEPFETEFRIHRASDGATRWVSNYGRAEYDAATQKPLRFVGIAQDITERKRAEEQLKIAAQRTEVAQEAAQATLYEFIPQTDEVIRNATFSSVVGYQANESPLTGEHWQKLIHPDDLAQAWETIGAGIQSGAGFELEYRVRRKDGRYIWLYDRARVIRNAQGEAERVVGMILDITERKCREENLAFLGEVSKDFGLLTSVVEIIQMAGERITTYLDLSHCLFVEIDEQANVAEVIHDQHAPGAPSLVGVYHLAEFHTASELEQLALGNPVVINDVWDESRPLAVAHGFEDLGIRALITAPFVSGGGWKFSLSAQRSQPREWQPQEVEVLRELAERIYVRLERAHAEERLRESEERLRLATNAAEMFSWELDLATNQTLVSENFASVIGFSDEQRPDDLDESIAALIHPDDTPSFAAAVEATAQGKGDFRRELRAINPLTKETFWVEIQGTLIRHKTPRVVGVVQNITGRKEIEARREQLLEQEQRAREVAEAGTRAKDEFLAVVSHELRNPLNAILGYTRLARKQAQNAATVVQYCDIIERNARMQQQLIEDLLDTARIISGKLKIEAAPTDLQEVMEQAIEVVRPAAAAKQIELLVNFHPEPQVLFGDAARLQQVIWNLLQNAIKFTPNGGRIEIWLEAERDHMQLFVRDNGAGIAPEFLPHLFDRFSQNDASRTRRQGGLGLGLALVKQLAELHGGSIQVASAGRGQGATFTLTLPRHALESPNTAAFPVRAVAEGTNSQESISLTELPRLDGMHLLVVDDQEDARELVAETLREWGAQVTTATSGIEARTCLSVQTFDVLVCDIAMPEEDGFSVIAKHRAYEQERNLSPERRLPAVALTARTQPEDRWQTLTAGFQMHIAKPVEVAELIVVIHSLTRDRSTANVPPLNPRINV
jgi:PAS domain S-box-containing protein